MQKIAKTSNTDITLALPTAILILLSLVVLNSIAPQLFPLYYLYIVLGIVSFIVFSNIDFDILSLFSKHLYVASIILLILPLIIGQVTRGTIRWIPIGALTIQPAEIVRPFLIVFFANYLTVEELTTKRLLRAVLLLILPVFLILIQPSLGVAILTIIAFVGVLLASGLKIKYYLLGFLFTFISLPVFWFAMKDYQRQRLVSFIDPSKDPTGAGYNSIQSMISVGSGKIFGRGLGRGVQTQLAFLPEKHSDFIFAAVSEELGLIGALVLLGLTFYLLTRFISILENSQTFAARAFMAGFFLTLLIQIVVHVGMNMGLLPITGVPYPLVSAGGSSLLATMAGVGIASSCQKKKGT